MATNKNGVQSFDQDDLELNNQIKDDIFDTDDIGSSLGGNNHDVNVDVEQSELTNFFEDLSQIEKTSPSLDERPHLKKKKFKSAGLMLGASSFLHKINIFRIFPFIFKKIFSTRLIKPLVYLGVLLSIGFGGYYLFMNNNFFKNFNFSKFTNFESLSSLLPSFSGKDVEIPEFNSDQGGVFVERGGFAKFQTSPNGIWQVQVAVCHNTSCVNSAMARINSSGAPSNLVVEEPKTFNGRFAKLYSSDLFQFESEAEDASSKISANSQLGLSPYVEKAGYGYRLVLGSFPLETFGINNVISQAKSEISNYYPDLLLDVSYEKVQSKVTKITFGPFSTRDTAQQLLDLLHRGPGFQQAVIVRR